jgi:hypothetical protein
LKNHVLSNKHFFSLRLILNFEPCRLFIVILPLHTNIWYAAFSIILSLAASAFYGLLSWGVVLNFKRLTDVQRSQSNVAFADTSVGGTDKARNVLYSLQYFADLHC